MADQKITELPIKTSSGIAATDYLLGIDSAEGYQMLIQDLGNYIINNVNATLGGASQTLAAAIGSTYNLVNSTAITSGLDLNTFINPGNYTAANNEAATLVNCPITRAFRMVVERSFTAANVNWVKQRLVKSADGETYERYTVNGGSTWTEWKRIDTDNKNVPHFATGSTTAGIPLTTSTNINQLLTGEYYWPNANYRPSANIPDNMAYRGRLWAIDSGGNNDSHAQICYTSNFTWFVRYCTSTSNYTWTDWKQINGIPKQLSGITSLSDIPLGSNGYAQFDASVSPTGATAYFTYWCTGVNDRRSIIAVYTADSVAKAYVNVLHNSDGVTWKGWKTITLS